MKYNKFCFTLLLLFLSKLIFSQTFTAGNIAVLATAPSALTSNTTASIIELNTTTANQTPVNTFNIDGITANAMRFSGSATSTGYLANSNNGTLLCFNGANNINTTSNVNTLNPRAVGTYNNNGTYAIQTTYNGTSGQQTRGSTTLDNLNWFIADQGGLYTNGTSAASPSGNFRAMKSFGGVVYTMRSSASFASVSTVSAPSAATITDLPGLPLGTTTTQDFYLVSSGMNGASFDILYVLTTTSASAGSIAKYSLVGGVWVANGTSPTTFGGFGMAAKRVCNGIELYISSGTGATVSNSLIKLLDASGYNTTININAVNNVTLYTASGTIIKGVAFAPVPACSPSTLATLSLAPAAFSTICAGNTTTLKVDITGGTPPYTLVYSDGTNCITLNGYLSGNSIQVSPTVTTTYSLVSVTSANGCQGSGNSGAVTITVNPTLITSCTLNANPVSPICTGTSVTFTATATGTGVSPTYNFIKNGTIVQSGSSNTYTTAGLVDQDTIRCSMTSSANCALPLTSTSSNILMTVNPIPTAIVSPSTTAICLGSSTNLSVSGTAVSYNWMPGNITNNTASVSPLVNTTYTVTGTSAGCSTTATVLVNVNTLPSLSLSAAPILCNGGTTSINANATLGATPYLYILNNTLPFQSTSTFNSITNGSYTVTVADANSCTKTSTIVLSQPTAINLNTTFTPISCNGNLTNITANANGGTGTIQYSLNGGTYQSNGLFTNITAGNYTVTAQDANNCTVSSSFSITEPTAITLSATATSINCNGGQSTLTASASGGTGTLQYRLNAGTYSTTTVYNGLNAGTYTVTVKDGNNCTESTIVIISQPSAINLTASSINATCNGANGTLNFSAIGGIGTITYSVNGTSQSSPFATIAGTYTIVATDANLCSTSTVLTITQPTAVVLTASATNATCNGGNGSLTFSATGGTGVKTFTVNASAALSPTLAVAGTYIIVATDVNGCTSTSSLTITEPSLIILSASPSPAGCFGANGNITFSATGGSGSISYTVNGTAATSPYTGASGTYTIIATDANNCTKSTSVTITQPNVLNLSVTSTAINCNGGTSTINAIGSGGAGSLSYNLNGGSYQGSGSFLNNVASTYTVSVKDANNCSVTSTVNIMQPTLLTANSLATPIVCNGGSSTVNVGASGGTSPYTGTGSFVTPAGPYSFTVTDANGCSAITSGSITQPSPLIASSTHSTILCNGGTTTVTISASGGVSPYTGTGVINNVGAGSYSYTISDNNGCMASTSGSIPQPSTILVSASHAPIQCYGNYTNVIVSAVGGTAPYTGTGTFLQGAGQYNYTITDNNGCTGTLTSYNVSEPTQLIASSSPASISCGQTIVNITVSATGGTPPYGGTGVLPALVGFYGFTVTDNNGCGAFTSGTTVAPNTTIVSATASSTTNCGGNTIVDLSANGTGTNYNWQPGNLNGANQSVLVTGNQTYTVTATSAGLCSATSVVSINLTPVSGSLAQSTSNVSFAGLTSQTLTQLDGASLSYYNASCDIIATVTDAIGSNVLGITTANVFVDGITQQYNGQPYVRRHYEIIPTNNGPATIKLFLTQNDFDTYNLNNGSYPDLPTTGSNTDPNIPNIRITKVSGALGSGVPTVITPSVFWNGTYWELSFPVTGFSQFYFHSVNPGNAALPANVTHFDGHKSTTSNLLSWITSQEQNNDHFNLQYSTNGIDFETITTVKSKAQLGNSNIDLQYLYEHLTPRYGHNYYRLQQVDIDQHSSMHLNVIDIIRCNDQSTLIVYPNPSSDVVNIELNTPTTQNTIIKLMDMSGRIVKQIQTVSHEGNNQYQLSVKELANGLYTYQILNNQQLMYTGKIQKQD